jgi:hypothetical protein
VSVSLSLPFARLRWHTLSVESLLGNYKYLSRLVTGTNERQRSLGQYAGVYDIVENVTAVYTLFTSPLSPYSWDITQ